MMICLMQAGTQIDSMNLFVVLSLFFGATVQASLLPPTHEGLFRTRVLLASSPSPKSEKLTCGSSAPWSGSARPNRVRAGTQILVLAAGNDRAKRGPSMRAWRRTTHYGRQTHGPGLLGNHILGLPTRLVPCISTPFSAGDVLPNQFLKFMPLVLRRSCLPHCLPLLSTLWSVLLLILPSQKLQDFWLAPANKQTRKVLLLVVGDL